MYQKFRPEGVSIPANVEKAWKIYHQSLVILFLLKYLLMYLTGKSDADRGELWMLIYKLV